VQDRRRITVDGVHSGAGLVGQLRSGKVRSCDSRNRYSSKMVIGDDRPIELAVPCDCYNSFEPQLFAKGRTRSKALKTGLSASTRAFRSEDPEHMQELYYIAVSSEVISLVTDAVDNEIREWHNWLLDLLIPLSFFERAAGQVPR
jgi:transposase-like protein